MQRFHVFRVKYIILTFSTANWMAERTWFSSRTSTMQGSALPPASSTAQQKRGVNHANRVPEHAATLFSQIRTFLCRRVNRAGQLRVRLRRLRGDHNVGAVAGRLQGDRLADAARGARNEQRPAGQFSARKIVIWSFFHVIARIESATRFLSPTRRHRCRVGDMIRVRLRTLTQC